MRVSAFKLSILGLLLLINAKFAMAEDAIDLLSLYLESRSADPRILKAAALEKSSADRQREALGRLLPQLNANANFNRSQRDDNLTRSQYNGQGYALGLSQLLYAPQAWRSYQKFSALTRQSVFEHENASIQASIDLAERYFATLAAEDERRLIQAELAATERNHVRLEALFAKKMAKVTDVLELKARVDLLKVRSIEAANQIEINKEAISELIGRPIDQPLKRLAAHPDFVPPQNDKEFWVMTALRSNPAFQASGQALDAAQAAVSEAKAGHLPTLAFDINAQRSDIGYEGAMAPRSETYVASLGLQIPLYSGGSTQARVGSLYAELDAAQQEHEALRRQIVRETRTAYFNIEASLSRVAALEFALASAEKSRSATEQAFSYGVVNAVDVLNGIEMEFRAKRDLLQSQYNFITSLLMLYRWSGRLSEADVRRVNSWLIHPG
ncbi:TolC family protein [Pseudomonas mendocina]|uniref:TolC family protein n=1 Tax=Ectopseudomonas mendocina TaxID=300 RepID=UPI0023DC868E|nr:TolC family protein [Pseudomonas mendocina]MDF2074316.1 TolC family protein [Pseudomonas mendocina]